MRSSGQPARTAKEAVLRNTPVFQNTVVCRQIYTPETELSDLHFHEFIEISIVTEGVGVHCVFNNATECRKGDIYILNAGVPHNYFARSETECPTVCNLLFDAGDWFTGAEARSDDPRFCYGVFRDNPPFSYAVLTPNVLEDVMRPYNLIAQEAAAKRPDWQAAIRSYLTLLLITVERYVNRAEQLMPLHKNWFVVSAAIRMATENLSDPGMTLTVIAQTLHLSKSYLSRLFHQVTGTAFSDYLQHIRLLRARRLLKETRLSNAEISAACGLRDLQTFYRIFKEGTGMTPHQFRAAQESDPTVSSPRAPALLSAISEALQKGRVRELEDTIRRALTLLPAEVILNQGLLPGMTVLGQRFRNNEIYIPEVLLASRAMNCALQLLRPLLVGSSKVPVGRVCIGTVQGDLHDIGKNLVRIMLEASGLEVIDLGVDVAPEAFICTAVEKECPLICCSVLLSTSMSAMASVVQCAEQAGVRDRIKILVGGAPVTESFCRQIGADLYGGDAATTAELALALFQTDVKSSAPTD